MADNYSDDEVPGYAETEELNGYLPGDDNAPSWYVSRDDERPTADQSASNDPAHGAADDDGTYAVGRKIIDRAAPGTILRCGISETAPAVLHFEGQVDAPASDFSFGLKIDRQPFEITAYNVPVRWHQFLVDELLRMNEGLNPSIRFA